MSYWNCVIRARAPSLFLWGVLQAGIIHTVYKQRSHANAKDLLGALPARKEDVPATSWDHTVGGWAPALLRRHIPLSPHLLSTPPVKVTGMEWAVILVGCLTGTATLSTLGPPDNPISQRGTGRADPLVMPVSNAQPDHGSTRIWHGIDDASVVTFVTDPTGWCRSQSYCGGLLRLYFNVAFSKAQNSGTGFPSIRGTHISLTPKEVWPLVPKYQSKCRTVASSGSATTVVINNRCLFQVVYSRACVSAVWAVDIASGALSPRRANLTGILLLWRKTSHQW
ncbi:hypothetical protein BJ322DRAFT_1019406 [Thelephora terrestris]|uniref:Uncharacterized protein n=1 Tax=Thelephora terrestris TaxID=56493 RepID=A0A9P6L8J3_9AGAM|nr:hypothetical protein BJ322DRAFT_1019406 [Thelephora terrestris]